MREKPLVPEDEGVAKFAAPLYSLIKKLEQKRAAAGQG